MQFLMLVCLDTEPVNSTSTGMEIEEWVEKYDKEGVRQLGDRIQPESAATTIRVRNDEVLVTDGPFVETKEVVAGFDILDCRDLEHAIQVASEHPMAHAGVLELRPFWNWDEES